MKCNIQLIGVFVVVVLFCLITYEFVNTGTVSNLAVFTLLGAVGLKYILQQCTETTFGGTEDDCNELNEINDIQLTEINELNLENEDLLRQSTTLGIRVNNLETNLSDITARLDKEKNDNASLTNTLKLCRDEASQKVNLSTSELNLLKKDYEQALDKKQSIIDNNERSYNEKIAALEKQIEDDEDDAMTTQSKLEQCNEDLAQAKLFKK